MRPQNIVIALAIIAGGAGFSAVPQRAVVTERQAAPAEIDFTALHQQASEALDNLRRLQHRRASTTGAAF